MELIEGSEYVSQVKNSKAYQSIIKQLRADGATEAEIDEYIKEEALATAIGDKGESFVNAAQKKEFKTWLEKLFDFVRKLTGLSKYSAEEIQNITLDEFLQGLWSISFQGNSYLKDHQPRKQTLCSLWLRSLKETSIRLWL